MFCLIYFEKPCIYTTNTSKSIIAKKYMKLIIISHCYLPQLCLYIPIPELYCIHTTTISHKEMWFMSTKQVPNMLDLNYKNLKCLLMWLLFIHLFASSVVHSFIHSFILYFIHSFIHSHIYSFVQSFINAHIYIHLFFHSVIHSVSQLVWSTYSIYCSNLHISTHLTFWTKPISWYLRH